MYFQYMREIDFDAHLNHPTPLSSFLSMATSIGELHRSAMINTMLILWFYPDAHLSKMLLGERENFSANDDDEFVLADWGAR